MSRSGWASFISTAKFETTGSVTALFGASGSGKTSIVNMIAGLIAPDRGRIALDDTVLFDSATRVNVPAHRRRIGYVFQEGRLFPHLTVAQNLDYGRWMGGADRPTPRSASASWRCSTSATCCRAGRASCPAASASVSRSAARC